MVDFSIIQVVLNVYKYCSRKLKDTPFTPEKKRINKHKRGSSKPELRAGNKRQCTHGAIAFGCAGNPNNQMDRLEYYHDCDRTLGKGTFGVVCLMIDTRTNEERAVKRMVPKKESHWKILEAEYNILCKLNHPNIVQLIDGFLVDDTFFFIMERCHGQDLFERIDNIGPYPEKAMKRLFQQLLSAVAYLHTQPTPIAHLDIKPENIMVDDGTHTIKLVDFGFAAECASLLYQSVGTELYCAPEILDKYVKEYDGVQADAWSCAVVAYVMLAGYPPFRNRYDIVRNRYSITDIAFSSVSKNTKTYIQDTFVLDTDTRLSVVDAIGVLL